MHSPLGVYIHVCVFIYGCLCNVSMCEIKSFWCMCMYVCMYVCMYIHTYVYSVYMFVICSLRKETLRISRNLRLDFLC